MRLRPLAAASIAVLGLGTLAACAPTDKTTDNPTVSSAAGSGTSAASSATPTCDKASLALRTAGTFTVATDNPAYEPWFSGNKPSNGKGFESAVAYAVANKLGFSNDQVKWVTASFNSVIAPTPKKFDVDINEVSISAKRKQAVDFSTGYYDVAQAVVTYKGSKIAAAKSLAALASAKLGAQVGTTSYDTITNTIKPSSRPAVFDTNDLAVQALKNHSIDGLVVDLPTGFYITAAELDSGVIVGQIPASGTPEQFGFVLEKGSKLTDCVSQAVDALRADGTLDKLKEQWLATAGNAPDLS
ncbi:ABC transporter substrate-binding protein [Jatrophihabitans telluris]|uniref:ABC transporter substrate-binding protein n=1 Tax=Jatrophihabitans telluris TaxID=2038343 RepID=A0ABY4R177_9ACTN|nr:ABC transporter substrate-binding protein [Jatrophihabitans telluris]UQX88876.1 ABC transporter substrate-binding protein [Jatrophihabitans telluris]